MEEEPAVVQQLQQSPELLMVGVSTCNMETPLKIKNKIILHLFLMVYFYFYFIYFCFEIYLTYHHIFMISSS